MMVLPLEGHWIIWINRLLLWLNFVLPLVLVSVVADGQIVLQVVIGDSPRIWLDDCAVVHHHWWGLERLCLSWHKALQEVRGVVVLVHLLFLVLVRRENRGRAGVWILFCIKLPICSSLNIENRACTLSNHPLSGIVEHWLLGVEQRLLVDGDGEALVLALAVLHLVPVVVVLLAAVLQVVHQVSC